jgi:hypothetical protein
MNQASFYCPHCQQNKLFQANEMNHTPHILASVFLCGLWLPIWILTAITYNAPYHCSSCGFSDSLAYLRDPRLREQQAAAAEAKRQFRAQVLLERGDSTFQEKLAYFVSDNKGALIALGLGGGFLGIIIIFATVVSQIGPNAARQTVKPSVVTSIDPAVARRQDFAKQILLLYQTQYPDLVCYVAGDSGKTLEMRSKTLNDALVAKFEANQVERMRELGFTDLRFTSGKKQWSHPINSR